MGGCRHEAEKHEDLVEGGLECVGSLPASWPLRVGAQDMVIGHDVTEAERLGRLRVVANGDRIVAEFGLGKDDTDVHVYLHITGAGGRPRQPSPSPLPGRERATGADTP